MLAQTDRSRRRARRATRTLPASATTATQGYLVGLIGGTLALGLVVWDARLRLGAATGNAETTAAFLEGPTGFALPLALVTAIVSFLLFLRFRALAGRELSEHADLGSADETLQALLGVVAHGVILVDPSGRIRLFNPAAELLFGRLGEESLGLPIDALLPDLRLSGELAGRPDDDCPGPRLRHLDGLRADGQRFPVRLLLRTLALRGEVVWLLLAEDLTDAERSERRLEFLERRDALTGLQNRPTFERILGGITPTPSDEGPNHALCLIDIDRFKVINDTFGHAAGNKLLEQLGQIINTKLSCATALARLSGDEIAALFIGRAAGRAVDLCEELIRTTRNFLFTWQERSIDITLSIGVVVFDVAKVPAIEALGQADIACRIAKKKGRDRLHLYGHGDVESVRHRGDLALVPTIGKALSEGRFRIMAQPIHALHGEDPLVHYEILARMPDEHGNAVVPDTFIGAAERHILMPAIDRWIITHVFSHQGEQLRAWSEINPKRFMLAINLSGTTLLDDGFLPYLKRQFAEYRVPYPSICFEITETAAVSDLRRARSFMQEIRSLGACFAVDDFGTGFASYAYLKYLPVDYLKIDGSFVRNLETDPVDRALVSSINHIGHVLGLKTIAEWAETPQLIETLRQMGVDYAQGFGIGQPLRLEDLRLKNPADTQPARDPAVPVPRQRILN